MARPTVIDLNPVELNYYLIIIRLDKCNGTCNNVDGLSTEICVRSETKHVTVKVFNIIQRVYEAKTLVKHALCDFKFRFSSTTYSSN